MQFSVKCWGRVPWWGGHGGGLVFHFSPLFCSLCCFSDSWFLFFLSAMWIKRNYKTNGLSYLFFNKSVLKGLYRKWSLPCDEIILKFDFLNSIYKKTHFLPQQKI